MIDYDDYYEDDCDENEREFKNDECPSCCGGGCNYCLMLEW